MSVDKVFTARFPSSCKPTLCLLRRSLRLSRELAYDVVRARGRCILKSSEYYWSNALQPVFDDKIHGLTRWWCDSGTLLEEILYIDGKRHGLEQHWYENGTLRAEIPYVDGKRHGLARAWYANGTLWMEIQHVDGKRHGIARWWRNDGSFEKERVYSNACIGLSCVNVF